MSDRILRTAAARNCMGHRGACWVAEKTNVNASGQRAVGSAAQQGRAWTSRSGESASWMRADMPPLATSCSARVASLHKLASAAAAGRCSSASAVGSPLGCAAAEQKGCFYIFVCSTGILTVALQGKFYVLSAKSGWHCLDSDGGCSSKPNTNQAPMQRQSRRLHNGSRPGNLPGKAS